MTMMHVEIGDAVRFSKTVGEADVYLFAGVTGDFSGNHVDEEFMKKSKYGRRIAHGALLVGYMSTASTRMIERSLSKGIELDAGCARLRSRSLPQSGLPRRHDQRHLHHPGNRRGAPPDPRAGRCAQSVRFDRRGRRAPHKVGSERDRQCGRAFAARRDRAKPMSVGRTAIVTGGGTGIGRAIALGLAAAGCDVGAHRPHGRVAAKGCRGYCDRRAPRLRRDG